MRLPAVFILLLVSLGKWKDVFNNYILCYKIVYSLIKPKKECMFCLAYTKDDNMLH